MLRAKVSRTVELASRKFFRALPCSLRSSIQTSRYNFSRFFSGAALLACGKFSRLMKNRQKIIRKSVESRREQGEALDERIVRNYAEVLGLVERMSHEAGFAKTDSESLKSREGGRAVLPDSRNRLIKNAIPRK